MGPEDRKEANSAGHLGARYDGSCLASSRLDVEDNKKIADWLKNRKHFLIYLGVPGCGKSYFCASVYNFLRDQKMDVRVWKESEFLGKIRNSIDMNGDYTEAVKYFTDYEYFIYDDLGSTGLTDWRKEILLNIIDTRYSSKKPTIFTSNLSKEEIMEKLGNRSYSRLFDNENTILNFGNIDWRTIEPQSASNNPEGIQ